MKPCNGFHFKNLPPRLFLQEVVSTRLFCCDQYGGVGRDAFFATGETKFLGGGSLDGDVIDVAAYDLGHALFHGWDMTRGQVSDI